jgi:hypothetical protein
MSEDNVAEDLLPLVASFNSKVLDHIILVYILVPWHPNANN